MYKTFPSVSMHLDDDAEHLTVHQTAVSCIHTYICITFHSIQVHTALYGTHHMCKWNFHETSIRSLGSKFIISPLVCCIAHMFFKQNSRLVNDGLLFFGLMRFFAIINAINSHIVDNYPHVQENTTYVFRVVGIL